MIILGNRVPYEYFMTKGKGESNAGSEGLPYETGSYSVLRTPGVILQFLEIIRFINIMSVTAW